MNDWQPEDRDKGLRAGWLNAGNPRAFLPIGLAFVGGVLAVFAPLFILAVPLVDMVQVVIGRWRRGQPFYLGDTNHLSHLLVRRGLSRSTAVLLLWLAAAALGAVPVFW